MMTITNCILRMINEMIKYEPKVGEVYKLMELRYRYGDYTLSELIVKQLIKMSNVIFAMV